VEGRVLLDGKPLNNILVSFLPDPNEQTFGPNSTAITDEEGHYRLVCEEKARRPGVIAGTHRVTLIDLDNVRLPIRGARPAGVGPKARQQGMSNAKGKPKRRLAPQYTDWAATPLKKKVEEGSQTIDFELMRISAGRTGGR
jgi:hypothetical protein